MWHLDVGHKYLTKYVVNFDSEFGDNHYRRAQFIRDNALHAYVESFPSLLGDFQAINLLGISFDTLNGTLRPGIPLDYTSVSTRVKMSDQYREEVVSMIKNIFPQEGVYCYFMRYMGSLLIPGNHDKIFMVWSGTRDNGKSVMARLIELTLGDYAVKLPTSLVTGKRSASATATLELILLDKKLVAFLQEPSHTENLNISIVKELTGNDTMYFRALYKNGRNIHIKAKLIYIVNSTENIAVIEEAIWNRIVILPFITHFTSKIQKPNDRLRDPDLLRKLLMYAGSFLYLLVEEAKSYLKEGLLASPTVATTTSSVKLDNDYIYKYLSIQDIDHSYPDFIAFMKEFFREFSLPPQLCSIREIAPDLL